MNSWRKKDIEEWVELTTTDDDVNLTEYLRGARTAPAMVLELLQALEEETERADHEAMGHKLVVDNWNSSTEKIRETMKAYKAAAEAVIYDIENGLISDSTWDLVEFARELESGRYG